MKVFNKVICALIAQVFLFSWCYGSAPGVTKDSVKLGGHSIMSGPLGFFGAISKVQKAYFEMINKKGGVNGRKIEFLVEDNGFDGGKALNATKKLVEEKQVFAMFSGMGMPHAAVYPYLKKKKVPDFFFTDASSSYANPPSAMAFQGIVTFKDEGRTLGSYIAKNFAKKKIGFLVPMTPGGEETLNAAIAELKGKVEIGPVEKVSWDAVSVDTQILKLKQAKVDLVLAITVPPITPSAIKFANQNDFKPKWVTITYNFNDTLIELLGKDSANGIVSDSNFVLASEVGHLGLEEHKKFMKEYLSDVRVDGMSIYAQAIAELMVKVLEGAGPNLTRESAVKAAEGLTNFTCSLCLKPIRLGPKDHLAFKENDLFEIKNGKWSAL